MSPEQLLGERVDGRADQFAWAVLGYELLHGRAPWRTSEACNVPAAILSSRVEPFGAHVPRAVEAVLAKAMSRDPERRYASMRTAFHALQAALCGQDEPPPHVSDAEATTRTAAVTGVSVTRRRAVQGSLVASSVFVLMLAATIGGFALRSTRPQSQASAAGSSGASTTSPPPTATPHRTLEGTEAEAAFHAGIQLFRDASTAPSLEKLAQATRIEPAFAAAHLAYVVRARYLTPALRAHFHSAMAHREKLADHERRLLLAYAPMVNDPPDLDQTITRLADLVAQNPRSAELWMALARRQLFTSKTHDALKSCDAALALEPELAVAWQHKATALWSLDRVDEALGAYDACLKASPYSTSCLRDLAEIRAWDGSCAQAETFSRRLIVAAPESQDGYRLLAESLAGQDATVSALREVLSQRWSRLSVEDRDWARARDEFLLQLRDGASDGALATVNAWCAGVQNRTDSYERGYPLARRVELLTELGRHEEARSRAASLLLLAETWTAVDNYDVRADALAMAYKAGAIDRVTMLARRDRLESMWNATSFGSPALRWFFAHARMTKTAEDGREAAARMPKEPGFSDENLYFHYADHEAPIGIALALGDKGEGALVHLTRATRSCTIDVLSQAPAALVAYRTMQAAHRREEACQVHAQAERWGGRWSSSISLSELARQARRECR